MPKSSKRRMRRCCRDKRAFDTLEEAKRAAAGMAYRKAKKGIPIVTHLRAYGCPCGKFHYGKTKQIDWDRVR